MTPQPELVRRFVEEARIGGQLQHPGIAAVYDLGRFVAGLTVFSTLYSQDPTGIVKPEGFYGSSVAFRTEVYDAVYEAIWAVVDGHPLTGVGRPRSLRRARRASIPPPILKRRRC